MVKWAVELVSYGLMYELRTTIKSQVLEDFVAEFSVDLQIPAEKEVQQLNILEGSEEPWVLRVDGASNVKGSGVKVVLVQS